MQLLLLPLLPLLRCELAWMKADWRGHGGYRIYGLDDSASFCIQLGGRRRSRL